MTQQKSSNNKKKPEQKQKKSWATIKEIEHQPNIKARKAKKTIEQQHCKRSKTITQEVWTSQLKISITSHKKNKIQWSMVVHHKFTSFIGSFCSKYVIS